MKKKSVWKRILLILLSVICALILAFGGYLLAVFFLTRDYFASSVKEFLIPGIDEGIVPQGIFYEEETDLFYLSGYKRGGRPSLLSVVDRKSGQITAWADLLNEDGSLFTGHSGSVSVFGDYVYVASTYDGLTVFRREELLQCRERGQIRAVGTVSLKAGGAPMRASFVAIHDGYIIVGEFQHDLFAPSPRSHNFTTPAGETTKALAACYRLDEKQPLGIDPKAAMFFTLPTMSQGICFDGETLFVCSSLAIPLSKIYIYDASEPAAIGEMDEAPVYALDSSVLKGSWSYPPMAEDLACADGKIYSISESASGSYLYGRLFGLQYCYSRKIAD